MIQKTEKYRKKTKFNVILTASVLVFLVLFYVVMNAIIGATGDGSGTGSGDGDKLPIESGESYYGSNRIAYPYFSEQNVQSIVVSYKDDDGAKQKFMIYRQKTSDSFIFYYSDENGDMVKYAPPICTEEYDFDYSELYAIESSDGLNLFKLNYLCAALGVLYFHERIPLSENNAERAAQLNRYGLGEGDREGISVTYLDKDGKQQTNNIFVGDKLITGLGHYFMIEGRDYVYNTISNNLDYALDGFIPFLHSRLVSAGLSGDSTYEPYLTTGYKQWKNVVYKTDGLAVKNDSKVVVTADLLTPLHKDVLDTAGLYDRTGYKQISMDTARLGASSMFRPVMNTLLSSSIGKLGDTGKTLTVLSNANPALLGTTYSYLISEICSVFTDGADVDTEGTPVGDHRYVKVRYDYTYKDGEEQKTYFSYGLIDLENDEGSIPTETLDKLRAAKVGELDTPITFEITYDENNADSYDVEYVIDNITLILKLDENGKQIKHSKVQSDSIVSFTYYYRMEGEAISDPESYTVDLSKITDTASNDYKIKQRLLGKSVGSGLDLVGYTDTMYCQAISDFIAYDVRSIDYFVVSEPVVSFSFVNASERDVFYGESLYINTTEGPNRYYGLNSSACESTVRLLGGINSDSSSTLSAGLVGGETVAVGLTPENMNKYGLYANTIHFELPRNIIVHSSGSDKVVDDFGYTDKLIFTLYVSDEQVDGTRYIGSDMYDIIVRIDGARFEYLDMSFVEYWARRNVASVNYTEIEGMTFDFYMEDFYGSYYLDVEHDTKWIVDGELKDVQPENGGQEYDKITVRAHVTSEQASETLVKRLLGELELDSVMLSTVYSEAKGSDKVVMDGYDTLGSSNFKELLSLIYSTYYHGILTPEEQAAAFESAPLLMRMSFEVPNSSAYPYVYEFYRIDDRRVMVSIYQDTTSGEIGRVSSFYLTTFAFKKIVRNYVELMNGIELDVDLGYRPETN